VPVVPQLRSPLEFVSLLDVLLHHLGHNITSVNINDYHGLKGGAELIAHVTTHELNDFFNLSGEGVTVVYKTFFFGNSIFYTSCPVNLVNGKDDLTRPVLYPVGTLDFVVLF